MAPHQALYYSPLKTVFNRYDISSNIKHIPRSEQLKRRVTSVLKTKAVNNVDRKNIKGGVFHSEKHSEGQFRATPHEQV